MNVSTRRDPVLFVITDLHRGGSPLMLLDLVKGLAAGVEYGGGEGRFEPIVVSLKPFPAVDGGRSIPEQLHAADIQVQSLELARPWQLATAIGRLRALINQTRPSIVYSILIHANAVTALALRPLRQNGVPTFVQSIHTLQPKPRWHWWLQRRIVGKADAFIAPDAAILQKVFSSVGSRTKDALKRGQAYVIPNGIDVDHFADAEPMPASARPWPVDAKVVGYVGRFDPVKSLPLLIEAVARLTKRVDSKPWHLAMVGYGPQEAELRSLAMAFGIGDRVHFMGRSTTPERWYKCFDVMCLPSSVEGFGLIFLEAIAAGIPVVGVKTPVTVRVVREGIDGRLVEIATAESLAIAIEEVMKNRPQNTGSPTFSHHPTRTYLTDTFSVKIMVQRHSKFFENILIHPS